MSWIYLILAGLCEIAFTTALRYVDGFTRPVPTLLFIAFAAMSFYFLQKSLAGLPLGTAYAVWTGIGAAGTVVVGIAFFGEPLTGLRVFFLALLIGAIAGLKLVAE